MNSGHSFLLLVDVLFDGMRLGPLLFVAEKVLLYAVAWVHITLFVETDRPRVLPWLLRRH